MEIPNPADLFEEIPPGITYLNCSNMSPQLKSVTSDIDRLFTALASAI
jgi:hypothetical protein